MEENRPHELDIKIEALSRLVQEVKENQNKIAEALLGSFDKNSVGLIEETRNLRREVNALTARSNIQEAEVASLNTFKGDAKKIVAIIAFAIPFTFEVIKSLGSLLWEYLKKP